MLWMWLRDLWWKHIVWRRFDTVRNKAIQYNVQRKTIRSWIARGVVRSFVEDAVTYVHREDCRRQYAKIEKQSKAQRLRYVQERALRPATPSPYGIGMLTRLGDAQDAINVITNMIEKAGAAVEEPEPNGETNDAEGSAEDRQP